MEYSDLAGNDMAELLRLTQTNVTLDDKEALGIAEYAYGRAEDPVSLGTAARQAMIRAEQAGASPQVVEGWLLKSRAALSTDQPAIKRERIATELLNGRVLGLRIERLGAKAVAWAIEDARASFATGEQILLTQHRTGGSWDRFGTMLTRHRATFEAMNGSGVFAAATALRGIWRALRAENEGIPEKQLRFVTKQAGMNALAGALAVTKPLAIIPPIKQYRHKAALKMLS